MRRSRILLALIVAVISLISYYSIRQENPFTGEVQHISMSVDQEISLGLQMEPQMAEEMGGLDPDPAVQGLVRQVGERVVRESGAGRTPYHFEFHALAGQETVNAFALPGGPVFITRGLLQRLENEAELAGVLSHEVGHVVARHSAARIAKSQLAQRLVGAAGIAGSGDDGSGAHATQVALVVAQMVELRYGRKDEIQADTMGVRLMASAGYDPRALIQLMRILQEASGGASRPEFLSTHPDPGNRKEIIDAAIRRLYPQGIPPMLGLGVVFATEPDQDSEPDSESESEQTP
jgi:beta-barrel assembly-enhancing protease